MPAMSHTTTSEYTRDVVTVLVGLGTRTHTQMRAMCAMRMKKNARANVQMRVSSEGP